MESAPPPADPLAASALVGRGDTYEVRQLIAELDKKQDWAAMVRLAVEQQKGDPENSDWGVVAGYGWLRGRDYAKAIAALSRVTQRNPEDVSAWNLLGESQRQAGQPGRATQTLEHASIIGRTSYLTFFLLGEAYRDAGRLDRAIGAYREAVRLEPLFPRGWFELGSAQVRIGERKDAEAALETLQKLDPSLAVRLKERIEAKSK
ncbi:MAG TPA: tetratricopeptide repeat protein [Burkholderiales bacterium]|nr:tetratricopeptide repeat protein [Burkholderiales bacterium]